LSLGDVRGCDLGRGIFGSGSLAVEFGDRVGDVFAGEGEGRMDVFAAVIEPSFKLEGC
jgi:hypothetical protein